MSIVRWDRADAVGFMDPLAVDELDGSVLVIDGVTAADDEALQWCRRAPCVVVACTPAGDAPPQAADVALVGDEADTLLQPLADRVDANPHACRLLVDVLRAMPSLDVDAGLTLESFAYSALLAGAEFARWLVAQPDRRRHAFAGEPVVVDRDGSVLRITLNRPENRNAFSAALRDAVFEALAAAVVDVSVERVVLAGQGPVFSSGGDLTEFGTTPDAVSAHEIRTRRSVGALVDRLAPKMTVHVHGGCVGAGVELPAFAGRVVAAPGTSFRLPEVAMGLIPGAGGTVSITRRIGRQRTARLAILGEPIGVDEALAVGLIDEIAEHGQDVGMG